MNAPNSALVRLRTQHRAVHALAILLTIAAGLASRRWPGLLPDALGKYPGDALYAVMVYWLVVFARPRSGIVRSAALALAICFGSGIINGGLHGLLPSYAVETGLGTGDLSLLLTVAAIAGLPVLETIFR